MKLSEFRLTLFKWLYKLTRRKRYKLLISLLIEHYRRGQKSIILENLPEYCIKKLKNRGFKIEKVKVSCGYEYIIRW